MISPRKRSLEEEKAATQKKKQKVYPTYPPGWGPVLIQPQKPHYGLHNQGATCYLNSVLQVLFMTTEIHDRLDPKSQITDEELRNIFEKLKETTCRTEKITRSLNIKNVFQQRDAAECLELILHEVSPKASEVFQGQVRDIIKCSEGHIINEETNPFWTLPLSLKDTHDATYSVERGFDRIFQPKSFSGDNVVYCNDCNNKTEATSGCEMVDFPQILALLLKRFDFDYNTMTYVKSDRCVDVPLTLQIKNKRYRLYGMVNHMGSLRGGHYTATILSNEDIWYEFNDTHVNKVKEQPFEKTRTYKSSFAYLLMYRASSQRDKVKPPQNVDTKKKEEHRRKSRETDADDKENRHLVKKKSQRQMRKEPHTHQVREENRDITEEEVLLHQKNPTSKQRPDSRTTPEERKQSSRKEDDKNCLQPCRSSADIKKNPLLIFLIVFACALIVILPVVLTTLNKP